MYHRTEYSLFMVQAQYPRWVENLHGEIVREQPQIRSPMIDRRKKAAGVSIPPGLVRRVTGNPRRSHEIPDLHSSFRVLSSIRAAGCTNGRDGQVRREVP